MKELKLHVAQFLPRWTRSSFSCQATARARAKHNFFSLSYLLFFRSHFKSFSFIRFREKGYFFFLLGYQKPSTISMPSHSISFHFYYLFMFYALWVTIKNGSVNTTELLPFICLLMNGGCCCCLIAVWYVRSGIICTHTKSIGNERRYYEQNI